MKHLRKVMALVLAAFMALVVSVPALAAAPDSGTITVNNTPKGETYAVYKILDATINNSGGIDYKGPIPQELQSVLQTVTVGTSPNTYSAIGKNPAVSDDDLFEALKNYVAVTVEGKADWEELVDGKQFPHATAQIVASSDSVTFDVDPGYYVVVSTQGTSVMIDSATDPEAEIDEKNSTTVTVEKKVDGDTSYSIGDTMKYIATFNTANYAEDANGDVRIITKFTISDTLPPFMTSATVTKVTVAGNEITPTPQFDQNKEFEIEWATKSGDTWTSKYNNGAVIVVEYEAVLTSVTNINANDTNTISIKPTFGDDEEPTEKHWEDDAEITTYAAALKKVDENNQPLAGAKFKVVGLQAEETEPGVYTVVKYDPATITFENSTEMEVDSRDASKGMLYIVGLKQGLSLTAKETVAPDGYNLLTADITLSPQVLNQQIYKTSGYEKYDSKGNLIERSETSSTEFVEVTKNLSELDEAAVKVENKKGTELPSTGGMGTRILYTIGGIMLVGGAVALVSKKRVANMEK